MFHTVLIVFILNLFLVTSLQSIKSNVQLPVGGLRTKLNDGTSMPVVGLGTWKSAPGEVKEAVYTSIKLGYRHIDCAWVYGNQHEVGDAVTQAIKEGIVKREDLFITGKLWNEFHEPSVVKDHAVDSLKQLKLDYMDLFLMHFPLVLKDGEPIKGDKLTPTVQETWQAMEKLVDGGMVKTIGVSNFSAKKVERMKEYAKYFPAVNQVELHPLNRQDDLLKTMSSLGVHVTAYAPLGSPDSSHEAFHSKKSVFDAPELKAISEETGKSIPAICIRWAVQRGTSVLPKSVKPERIAQNLDAFSWELTPEQFARINAMGDQGRFLHFSQWIGPEFPYKTLDDLWVN